MEKFCEKGWDSMGTVKPASFTVSLVIQDGKQPEGYASSEMKLRIIVNHE